jgi:hypothetical protein
MVSRNVRRVRVMRVGKLGEQVEQNVELESEDDVDEGDRHTKLGRKKKKRKDVWVGESFDIGREFKTGIAKQLAEDTAGPSKLVSNESRGWVTNRPASSRTTTQESFVTARTEISTTTESGIHAPLRPNGDAHGSSMSSPWDDEADSRPRHSGASSMQPLIGALSADEDTPSVKVNHKGKGKASTASLKAEPSGPKFRTKLKSAIRKASVGTLKTEDLGRMTDKVESGAKAKTVQFPVDLEEHTDGGEERPRKGNRAPVDPDEVLQREGDGAAGTSHLVVEQALEDEDEEDLLPGEVIMRGGSERR